MKGNNYFVFNCDYLYRQYFGNRIKEISNDRPSPSQLDTSFYHITIENTSGFMVSTGYRHYINNRFLVQFGIHFRNTRSSFLHKDSVVNENKSSIIREKRIQNSVAIPVYFGVQFKRFNFLTGIILPGATVSHGKNNFEDGAVSESVRNLTSSIWTDFYLSGRIQFTMFKEQNIGISVGADLDPEIFRRYRSGYLIHWNAGIVWMLEKKKKRIKPMDDVM